MSGMKKVVLDTRTDAGDEDVNMAIRTGDDVLTKLVTNFELNLDTNKIEPVIPSSSFKSEKADSNNGDEEDDLFKSLGGTVSWFCSFICIACRSDFNNVWGNPILL